MGITAASAGLLFKIDGDSSQLQREMKSVNASFDSVGNKLSSFGTAATVVTASVAAVGAAVAATGVGLFNFTKDAAEFASHLYDASVQTGLSAKSISALKLAADSSGSSLETISGQVAKFNVIVGQAAQGNDKAKASLEKYGITAKTADEAFNQAVEAIGKMTTADQKAAAAKDLFKDKTGQILPVIDQVNGNFKDYIKTAEKLGVTLTEKDLKAADDFGDTLEILGAQAKIAGVKFAAELMPAVTKAMTAISSAMSDNQSVVREWGRNVSDLLTGTVVTVQSTAAGISSALGAIDNAFGLNAGSAKRWAVTMIEEFARVASGFATAGLSEIIRYIRGVGAEANKITSLADLRKSDDTNTKPNPFKGITAAGGGGGKGGGGGRGGADKAKQEAEKEFREQIQYQEGLLNRLKASYQDALETARAEFKKTGDEGLFSQKTLDAQKAYVDGVIEVRARLLDLADQLGTLSKESDSALKLRLQKQLDDAQKISKSISDSNKQNQKDIDESEEKRKDRQKKLLDEIRDYSEKTSEEMHAFLTQNADDEIEAAKNAYIDLVNSGEASKKAVQAAFTDLNKLLARNYDALIIEENAVFENQKINLDEWKRKKEEEINQTVKDEEERKGAIQAVNDEYQRRLNLLKQIHDQNVKNIDQKTATPVVPGPSGPMDRLIQQWKDLKKAMLDVVGKKNILASFGSLAIETFQNMTEAVGSSIAAWALYGESIGLALKKALAAQLAHIAAVAAVNAIYATALGFLRLAEHDFAGAANAFISAGIWAAVAAAAAVGAKAVAGNSFKQQTSAGGGSGSGGSRDQSPQSRESSGAYNSGNQGNRHGEAFFRELRDHLRQTREVMSKFEAASPGDVMMRGIKARPGSIGQAAVNDIKRNSRIGRDLQTASGNKR